MRTGYCLFIVMISAGWANSSVEKQRLEIIFDGAAPAPSTALSGSGSGAPAAAPVTTAVAAPAKSQKLVPAKNQPKFQKSAGQHAISFFTWLGNLTLGLINTIIGAFAVLGVVIYRLGKDGKAPSFKMSSTGEQIVMLDNPYSPGYDFSLGIFQIGGGQDWEDRHETGHARQSALLGPFYLPLVGISYASVGEPEGFIEEWADDWAPPAPSPDAG